MPTAVHGLAWAAPTSWMHGHGWLRSALLCLAGVAVHEPGGQRGWHGTLHWLVRATFHDSKLRRYCENLVSLGPSLPRTPPKEGGEEAENEAPDPDDLLASLHPLPHLVILG